MPKSGWNCIREDCSKMDYSYSRPPPLTWILARSRARQELFESVVNVLDRRLDLIRELTRGEAPELVVRSERRCEISIGAEQPQVSVHYCYADEAASIQYDIELEGRVLIQHGDQHGHGHSHC